MTDTPIKICDYCGIEGVMPTFRDGETICTECLKLYPINPRVCRMKLYQLYHAVNAAMAYLGAYGEIDAKNKYIDAVMTALHDIDGGNVLLRKED